MQGDEVESTKAEMTGVKEENTRLKTLLQQIEKDYKSLQMRFLDIYKQESTKIVSPENSIDVNDQEHELVSLRLGTITETSKKEDIVHVTSTTSNSSKITSENDELKLGLDLKNPSSDSYNYSGRKEDGLEVEKWETNKGLKTERSGDEEISQTSVKRARVCVRARCDTPTMNDGCQWRKYGQKIAKGNPCPRAYYRCTVSPSCPVRKQERTKSNLYIYYPFQVQRCVEDMSILITTYEGTHNHPLPNSATAMASTTSAAASMLLSGSSTSTSTTTPTGLFGSPFQNTLRTQPNYYYPNPSSTALPTVTLDLTTNPTTTSTGFGLYSSSFQTTPKLPTSLSFSSSDSNMLPTIWGSGGGFSYGALPYSNNNHQNSLQFG
ncbi:hypothetical protein RD792_004217, partial [Penstemon davidsonii]